jgi:DHA2 family multidrug resistance protein
VVGPALGGWLTEYYSWRWCFFINLPIGILALTGVWLFISGNKLEKPKPFDFLGFGSIVVAVGAAQLLLDRGPSLDWFESRESWLWLLLAIGASWVFVVHTVSAAHPFFDKTLAQDKNFVTAVIFAFMIGILLFSSMALLPPMMQTLMGYPVLTAGIVNVPRGLGVFVAMMAVGQLINRFDTRLIIFTGLVLTSVANWQMMHFDLSMTMTPFITSGIIQGMGIGMIFVPLSVLAFATVPPRLRGEASSLYNLIRNLGSSVGISVMQALLVANGQVMHASLAERVNPADPAIAAAMAGRFDLATVAGREALNAEISRQATMVAYVDDFRLMFVISIVCMPMLLFMSRPNRNGGAPPVAHVD